MENNYHLLFYVEKIKKVLINSATIIIIIIIIIVIFASFDQRFYNVRVMQLMITIKRIINIISLMENFLFF